ncbi:MAG: SRPBCC family protein [Chloroflexi bacterium]|nr:SRPBCC family protein [Chloroflexota bacterium]
MIRLLLRLSVLGAFGAWLVDRILRRRAGGEPPPPERLMVVIDAPIERVWDELIDVEGQPRWMHDMKSVRLDEPGPVRVGTRGEATVRMYGLSVTDPVTITTIEPPTRFGLAHEGTFSGGGEFRLEAGVDGTTTIVRWEETLRPPVLPHLGAAVTSPVFRHVFQRDLERFRDLVEAAREGEGD